MSEWQASSAFFIRPNAGQAFVFAMSHVVDYSEWSVTSLVS